MTTNDKSQHPESRWVPKVFQLSLKLSKKSMKKNTPFLLLISMDDGFNFPNGSCCFTITDADQDSVLIKVLINTSDSISNRIGFRTVSSFEDISVACSKLNMSFSQKCKVNAKLHGDEVVFSIIAPSESAEKKLNDQYFSLFKSS